jgi:hypothetical protein
MILLAFCLSTPRRQLSQGGALGSYMMPFQGMT